MKLKKYKNVKQQKEVKNKNPHLGMSYQDNLYRRDNCSRDARRIFEIILVFRAILNAICVDVIELLFALRTLLVRWFFRAIK